MVDLFTCQILKVNVSKLSVLDQNSDKPLSFQITLKLNKGLFINDVTVIGRGGKGCCDDSTKAFVIKCVTIGGRPGGPNLRDVIYGRPLTAF